MTLEDIKGRVVATCKFGHDRLLNMFEKRYTITGGGPLIDECAEAVRELFIGRGFEARKFLFVDNGLKGCLVTIGKPKMRWNMQTVLGQSLAVWIRFREDGADALMEVGSGRWIDKIFSGTVAWMVFAPMMILPCFGAWRQYALIKHANEVVNVWLNQNMNRIGFVNVNAGI